GLTIVPLILAAYWFHGWYMNFSAGIFIKEKTAILPKITLIGASVTIIFNIILIPFFGMMGAASATILSNAVMALWLYKRSVGFFRVPYQIIRAGLMLLIAAFCILIKANIASLVGSEWLAGIILLILGLGSITLLGLSGTALTMRKQGV